MPSSEATRTVTVRVPATSANLGPGFDSLGLALDLWNEADFQWAEGGGSFQVSVAIEGEGASYLPTGERNLVARAALRLFKQADVTPSGELAISCRNRIPTGSGLGSSAAAFLAGLLGAYALLDGRAHHSGRALHGVHFGRQAILGFANELEGHADNAAAALYGGLVLVLPNAGEPLLWQAIPIPPWKVALAIPQFRLSTADARAVLPKTISLQAAATSIGRAALVVEALRRGDGNLLGKAMQDDLHQPYRLPLIPGAKEAIEKALKAGAAAAALSGAGPGIIAFLPPGNPEVGEQVQAAMLAAFDRRGIQARGFLLSTSQQGAAVESNPPSAEL